MSRSLPLYQCDIVALPSTLRIVVGCSYEDGWAADIAWTSLMAGMVILVPLTPSAVETMNGGVIDLLGLGLGLGLGEQN